MIFSISSWSFLSVSLKLAFNSATSNSACISSFLKLLAFINAFSALIKPKILSSSVLFWSLANFTDSLYRKFCFANGTVFRILIRSNSISISANFFPSAKAASVAFPVSSAKSFTDPTISSIPVATFNVAFPASSRPSPIKLKSLSIIP